MACTYTEGESLKILGSYNLGISISWQESFSGKKVRKKKHGKNDVRCHWEVIQHQNFFFTHLCTHCVCMLTHVFTYTHIHIHSQKSLHSNELELSTVKANLLSYSFVSETFRMILVEKIPFSQWIWKKIIDKNCGIVL